MDWGKCNHIDWGGDRKWCCGGCWQHCDEISSAICDCSGNPARFIKWRFPKEVQEKLEETRWFLLKKEDVLLRRDEFERIVGFDRGGFMTHYMDRKPDMRTDDA